MPVLFLTLIFVYNAYADEIAPIFHIKYKSSGHVYIDGGTADGLKSGDSLQVIRDNVLIANLEISYTAEHSSSCRVVGQSADIQAGDPVSATIRKSESMDAAETVEAPREEPVESKPVNIPRSDVKERQPRLNGRISVGYFFWNDRKTADLDFSQPGLGIKLNVGDVWGSGFSLNVRTRTRYNQRSKRYSNSVAQKELRNRIYEFSFDREDDRGFDIRFGRIIPRGISGAGYIDGALVNKRLSEVFKMGIFGGVQPEWQFGDPQTSLQKYGLYVSGGGNRQGGLRLESTLALVGEYHLFDVSREFIHFRNLLNNGSGLEIYQSADIDINRSWRHRKTGTTVALTNLYISARRRIGRRINIGISFDDRRRYWNYDQQTLADSLFDDLARRGLKATMNLRMPANFDLGSNVGISKREGFSETAASYSVSLAKSGLSKANFAIKVGASGFSNRYSNGLRISYDLGWYSRRGDNLAFGYGLYRYKYKSTDSIRSSRWLQWGWTLRLSRNIIFTGDVRKSAGDDLNGVTIMGDLGYSFR